MQHIHTKDAPAAIGPYSQAIRCGNTVYVSGQIPIVPETGTLAGNTIEAQAEQVCKNISAILSAAGTDVSRVLKATCFLRDLSDFATFNAIYEKHFVGKPARSCVEVSALPKGALVEVEVIAEVG